MTSRAESLRTLHRLLPLWSCWTSQRGFGAKRRLFGADVEVVTDTASQLVYACEHLDRLASSTPPG